MMLQKFAVRSKACTPRRRHRHRHPRDDPREDVGVRVGVGVVERQLNDAVDVNSAATATLTLQLYSAVDRSRSARVT